MFTTLFNHQYCYNLLTRLFSHDNNVVTALFNHQYCYNLLRRLFNHENDVVTALFNHQYCYNLLTRLSNNENNVVTALFNHQYCYNLLTRLNNNDNNSEQACSINIVFSRFNNREPPLLHQCWTTLTLLVEQHCSAMIAVLLHHCSTNNAVTTWAV